MLTINPYTAFEIYVIKSCTIATVIKHTKHINNIIAILVFCGISPLPRKILIVFSEVNEIPE
jgi:hypothetical protein